MVAKDRHNLVGRNARHFTKAEAAAIRSLYGVETQTVTAERLGVAQPTISKIQTGKTYRA
jgi:hypothetical protein